VCWQCVQLIVCDWLLTSRSEVWLTQQQHTGSSRTSSPDSQPDSVSSTEMELTGYKTDLTSLRHLAHTLRAAVPRVSTHIYTHTKSLLRQLVELSMHKVVLF